MSICLTVTSVYIEISETQTFLQATRNVQDSKSPQECEIDQYFHGLHSQKKT